MAHPVFTIGHSTRSIAEFVGLLALGKVDLVVDIRPRASVDPQYGAPTLAAALAAHRIDYAPIEELGGRRGRSMRIDPQVEASWTCPNLHAYAASPAFAAGLARLLDLSDECCLAIMCAEAAWRCCRRRIVADHLLVRGREVYHLMSPARLELARLTEGTYPVPDGPAYPAHSRVAG